MVIVQENINAQVSCWRAVLQRGSVHSRLFNKHLENDLDDVQIYIEDNNSTDGTVQEIETFLDSLPKRKESILIFISEQKRSVFAKTSTDRSK